MGRKTKMATSRKKQRRNNRLIEFFLALLGFWPVWTMLLLVVATVSGYHYFLHPRAMEATNKMVNEKAEVKTKTIKTKMIKTAVVDVQQIKVSGQYKYLDIGNLKTQVVALMQDGYLRSDLEQIRAKLAALPWIDQISLKRIPPRRIEIKITEHIPMLRWQQNGLISQQGVLFFPAIMATRKNAFKSLPLMKVKQNNIAAALGFLEQLLPSIEKMHLSFRQLEQDVLGGWTVTFANGERVVFGRKSFAQRLLWFTRIWPPATSQGVIKSMDLRYTNGAAVRFVDEEG